MFSKVEWLIAGRYIRTKKSEGFISVVAWFSLLGIMLGVGTLIIVLSVQNGLRAELVKSLLGFKGHIAIVSNEYKIFDYDKFISSIRSIANVAYVDPIIEGQLFASLNNRSEGVLARGIKKENLENRLIITENIIRGSIDNFSDNSIIIGSKLSSRLSAGVGDKITLVSPRGMITVFGSVPRVKAYTVTGIFEVGHYQFDRIFIFMPLETAQKFFQMKDQVSKVEVFLQDPDDLTLPKKSINKILKPELLVFDWQQENRSIFSAMQVQKNVMFLIVMLIVLVAAFNIVSSLIMMVKDKESAIAILRTIGASRGMIMRIFLIAGTSIGFAGTFFGTLAGVIITYYLIDFQDFLEALTGESFFSAEVFFFSQLPSKIEFYEVIMVSGLSLMISFLATLYPSFRAARIDPAEVLRND